MGLGRSWRWLFAGAFLAVLTHCGAKSGLDVGSGAPDAGGGRSGQGGFGGVGGGATGGTGASGGSGGVIMDAAVEACAPSPEACNGVDDDCDGLVDEELGVVPLGDPIVVRNDEGDTGDCSTCRWAFDPDLWVNEGGLLAVWQVSFNGSSPQSNLYARRLAIDGALLGPPFLLLEATGKTPRFAPRTSDRALLALCQRVGSLDRPATVELDPRAVIGTLTERSPAMSQCRTVSDVSATWTGERFVVAWSNAASPFGVALDIADASGTSVATRWLPEGGGSPARLAAGHGGLLLATARAQAPPGKTLVFHRLDAIGDSISPAVEHATADALQDAAIVAVPEGWLVYAWGFEVGLAVRLGPDGAITSIDPLALDPQGTGSRWPPDPGADSSLSKDARGAWRSPASCDGIERTAPSKRRGRLPTTIRWGTPPSSIATGLPGSCTARRRRASSRTKFACADSAAATRRVRAPTWGTCASASCRAATADGWDRAETRPAPLVGTFAASSASQGAATAQPSLASAPATSRAR